jgi:hypothetical protein
MDLLRELFGSRATADVVLQLFSQPFAPLHVRELARRTNLPATTCRRTLARLALLGLLEATRDGNRLLYRPQFRHPVSQDLRSIVAKSEGILSALRTVVIETKITVAFVHGPELARITEVGCPIRVVVVGTITKSRCERLLHHAGHGLGRQIEVETLSAWDLCRRHQRGDPALGEMLDSPRIMLRGTEMELVRIIEGRYQG